MSGIPSSPTKDLWDWLLALEPGGQATTEIALEAWPWVGPKGQTSSAFAWLLLSLP
ncbi:MAG TPA: hypothetical protein PKA06_08060 [Gemmatales bacterium]|nr:hypothetical protein [Gemmatales bacterium]